MYDTSTNLVDNILYILFFLVFVEHHDGGFGDAVC